MAYQIEYPWRRNPRLIKASYGDHVSDEDITHALEDIATLLDQAMMPMHVVIDFSYMENGPENVLDLFLKSRMPYHDKQGYCLFLHPDKFLRFIGQVLNHEAGLHVDFRDDDEGAWEFFSEMGFC